MTRAIMIDLETLATSPDSKILSIGAVEWDNDAAEFAVLREFEAVVSISGQDYAHLEEKTLEWWMTKTSQEAREAAFGGVKSSIAAALDAFNYWVKGPQIGLYPVVDEVWSKGADFDIAILKFHFAYHEIEVPWSYKAQRCFRQLTVDWPEVPYGILDKDKKHNAVEDATSQAEWCWRIQQYKKTVKQFAENWAKRTAVP